MGLFEDVIAKVGGTVGKLESYVESQWSSRLVQVAVYASLLFFLLGNFGLIDKVDKTLAKTVGLKLGKEGTRALHAVLFGVLLYFGSRFIMDPLIARIHFRQHAVEGMKNKRPVAKRAAPAKKPVAKRSPKKAVARR